MTDLYLNNQTACNQQTTVADQ